MKEAIVVSYVNGEVEVPPEFLSAVARYRELALVADHATVVPLSVDGEMNELYDLMVGSI